MTEKELRILKLPAHWVLKVAAKGSGKGRPRPPPKRGMVYRSLNLFGDVCFLLNHEDETFTSPQGK